MNWHADGVGTPTNTAVDGGSAGLPKLPHGVVAQSGGLAR